MLSKEEIEKLLKEISNGFRKIPQVENILYPLDINQFQKLNEYICQLESDKQKLIKKLETANELDKHTVQVYENMYRNATEEFYKKSYKRTIDMANARRETRKSILEIVKGVENG